MWVFGVIVVPEYVFQNKVIDNINYDYVFDIVVPEFFLNHNISYHMMRS
jgi:hypothetical protein